MGYAIDALTVFCLLSLWAVMVFYGRIAAQRLSRWLLAKVSVN